MRLKLAVPLLAILSFPSFAHSMSYTFIEGGWNNETVAKKQDTRQNGDGGYVLGSWEFVAPVYVFASYARAEKQVEKNAFYKQKVTQQTSSIGVGYYYPSADNLDFVADLAYAHYSGKDKLSTDAVDIEDSGSINSFRIDGGVRGMFSENGDGWFKVGYEHGSKSDDFDNRAFAQIGAQFKFNPMWAVAAQLEANHNATIWHLGVRANF